MSHRYSAASQQPAHQLVRTSLTVLLFLGVAGVAGWVLTVDLTHPAPAPGMPAATSPAAAAAASHPAISRGAFPLTDPFAGSPAENFAAGPAGVVPPALHAVGRYSAAQRPGAPATRMRIVVRDVVWVDFAVWDRVTGPLEPWWTPEGGGAAGGRCDVNDGYVHPDFPSGVPERARPSGNPINPYDQSVLPRHKGCQLTTGT